MRYKDSRRWLDLMNRAAANGSPTSRVILVADRAANIHEVWDHAPETGRDVLVRST